MRNEFQDRQEQYLSLINQTLDSTLLREEGKYGIVRQAMRYSTEAGGKRIRPILTLEFARICGGDIHKALPFACAVELIHTYSLIHDDLPCMDDDSLRRGKPSCHKKFGEANALLAGDALLTLAFELAASAPQSEGVSPEAAAKACAYLASFAGIGGMVGGQVMDLQNEKFLPSEEELIRTYRLKTSALLSAACMMGVLSVGGTENMAAIAMSYADRLGLAFQIVDDILDIIGVEEVLGKTIGSDSENKKVTYVTLLGLKEAEKKAETLTSEALNLLSDLPDSGFLVELTKQLLVRRK